MSDMPSTWHYVVPVKLPNLIDTYTQSDNKDFIKAFKDVVRHFSQSDELITDFVKSWAVSGKCLSIIAMPKAAIYSLTSH